MRDHKPPRQPLFWAASVFSLGLWTGVRAWRPPSWWVIAVVAFVFAASWFLAKRAWLAKALALGSWFLLGAFLIQIRGQLPGELQQDNARILALADGRIVTLTARVIREGYARAAGPRSIRESIDVETEKIASQGESWPVRAGVRLTIYERVEPVERRASSPDLDSPDFATQRSASMTGETPVAPFPLTYGTRLQIRAKLHPARNYPIPEPLIMKAIYAAPASVCWGRRRRRTLRGFLGFRAAASNSGGRAFIRASWLRFTNCGPRHRPRSWTPWFSAKNHSCRTPRGPSTSARARITCCLFPE